MRVAHEVLLGRCLPWYMGFAYNDPVRRYVILYPIPFNLIIGALRNLWIKLGNGIKQSDIEFIKAIANSRNDGFQIGHELGIKEGRRLQIEDFNREFESFLYREAFQK